MNSNGFSKKYSINQSPVDRKYRVFECMTLSNITKEMERDNYKKWICIGVFDSMKESKDFICKMDKKDE